MPPAGPAELRSALMVAVPEAEALVGELRLEHDPVARLGVPAHVTVLFPFIPALRALDQRDELARVFAELPIFDYQFERIARFGDTTVWLAPEPRDAFLRMTDAVVARWPEHLPYEGAFDEVIPHLSVGDMLGEGVADQLGARTLADLARHGPVTGTAREVTLIVEGEDGSWSTAATFPLGPRSR